MESETEIENGIETNANLYFAIKETFEEELPSLVAKSKGVTLPVLSPSRVRTKSKTPIISVRNLPRAANDDEEEE